MGFQTYFKTFCDTNGYKGTIGFNKVSIEYHIIITKGEDNGGAFMTKEELNEMNDNQIKDLLIFLDIGFKNKFNK